MPKKKKAKVDIKTKLQTLRNELKANFIERGEEIDGILIALLAQEHVLFLGPPGVAKTLLTSTIAGAIELSEYFEWLMSKFSCLAVFLLNL
jgi:MoxR-like ATPase